MPRKLCVEDPGALDHFMNRGDRCEPIVRDEADRRVFLATPSPGFLELGSSGMMEIPDLTP